jgi:hypothetical protein
VKPLAIVAFAFPTALAASAWAQAAPTSWPESESADFPRRPLDRREGDWRLEAGYRGSFVRDPGYQPFSSNGYLPEFSLSASHTLLEEGRFSFAGGLEWGVGNSSSLVRQVDEASIVMQRFTVMLEARLHFGRWGYAYLRAAPGAAWEKVELDDTASPAPLEKTNWLFATDLSAGYAWLAWPRDAAATLEPRFWLQGEGGYGWVAGQELTLNPALPSGSPIRTDGVDLGALAMQGGFFRVAAAVTF